MAGAGATAADKARLARLLALIATATTCGLFCGLIRNAHTAATDVRFDVGRARAATDAGAALELAPGAPYAAAERPRAPFGFAVGLAAAGAARAACGDNTSREGCERYPVAFARPFRTPREQAAAELAEPNFSARRARSLIDSAPEPPPLRCAALVYFHLPKSGGTALREAMERQSGERSRRITAREWVPPAPAVSWTVAPMGDALGALARWLRSPAARSSSPRLFVELHYPRLHGAFSRAVELLRRERGAAEASGCTIVTLVHLREPAAQALSAWYYWPQQWAREGVRSLDGWIARQLPDRVYDEFVLGRAATPGGAAERGTSGRGCARWVSEVEASFLSAVDVVGTDRNWERTWLRLAAMLRLPRLVPRAHRGLVACARAQHLRTRAGPLSARCQSVALCKASRVNATHVRALRARHACSVALYDAWARRSEEALGAFEAGLTRVRVGARDSHAPGAPGDGDGDGRSGARGPESALAPSAHALFRERTCQLRASYVCTLELSEAQRTQLQAAEAARLELRARTTAARASAAAGVMKRRD